MASYRGKKFDTWKFTIEKTPVSIAVKVRSLTSCHYDDDDDNKSKLEFFVRNDDWEIDDRDTDINALKGRVFAELEKKVKDSVTWKRFWHVKWNGESREIDFDEVDQEAAVKSKLEYTLIEIGTQSDGSKIWRQVMPENKSRWSAANAVEGEPLVGYDDKKFSYRKDTLHSLVPATKENEQSLLQIHEGFKKLHGLLYKFLDPKLVDKHLADLAGNMLPQPAIKRRSAV